MIHKNKPQRKDIILTCLNGHSITVTSGHFGMDCVYHCEEQDFKKKSGNKKEFVSFLKNLS